MHKAQGPILVTQVNQDYDLSQRDVSYLGSYPLNDKKGPGFGYFFPI